MHAFSSRVLVTLALPVALVAACATSTPSNQPSAAGPSSALTPIAAPSPVAATDVTGEISPPSEAADGAAAGTDAPSVVGVGAPAASTPGTPTPTPESAANPQADDASLAPTPVGPTPTIDMTAVMESPAIQTAIAGFSNMRFMLPPIPAPEPVAPIPAPTAEGTPVPSQP